MSGSDEIQQASARLMAMVAWREQGCPVPHPHANPDKPKQDSSEIAAAVGADVRTVCGAVREMSVRVPIKEAVSTAWTNAAAHVVLSPLMSAARDEYLAAAEAERPGGGLADFAKRIAAVPEGLELRGPSVLGYQLGWVGEWHVTNVDLCVFASFRMWLGRFAHFDEVSFFTGGVARALRLKRMQQAHDRYHASGITAVHCKLLGEMLWEVDTLRGDWISLFVQGKRPFGNSVVEYDIYNYAGWPMDWPEDAGMSEQQSERAWDLFDELAFAAPDAAKFAGECLRKIEEANRGE